MPESPSETLRAAAKWLREAQHIGVPVSGLSLLKSIDAAPLASWLEENALAASYDVDDVNGYALAFAQSLPIPKEPTNG